MTAGPTYLQFHVAFLVPALALLAATALISRPRLRGAAVWRLGEGRAYWTAVAVITVVAVVYTVPWDNYLIARGVWSYGEGTVAARLWHAPVGEYLFIVVQPSLTALWLSQLSLPTAWTPERRVWPRAAGVVLALAVGAWGWWLLATPSTFYLGAILAWGAPVLALQWAVGAVPLWARRRTVALGVLVPTAYLCVADRVAIEYGIWILSERYTTGLTVAGLPVEEATFFLVTNLFVVQGLVLYQWVLDRWVRERRQADPTPAAAPTDSERTSGLDAGR